MEINKSIEDWYNSNNIYKKIDIYNNKLNKSDEFIKFIDNNDNILLYCD